VNIKVILRPTVSRPVCPSIRPPSETCGQYCFLFYRHFLQTVPLSCNYGAPSVTRLRVCSLLLLLVLASAVFLNSKTLPTCWARFLRLFPVGTRYTGYTPPPPHKCIFSEPLRNTATVRDQTKSSLSCLTFCSSPTTKQRARRLRIMF
jgi:hypothetical protein